MSTLDRLQRMDYLVDLIQRKATGNVDQLAKKLNVSRRTVHNLIDVLKGMDAPIAWDPVRAT